MTILALDVVGYPTPVTPGATTTSVTLQGEWDATNNEPALASGVGTPGFAYEVSVPGTTNLDGNALWDVGDWAIFSDQWNRIRGGGAISAAEITGLDSSATTGNATSLGGVVAALYALLASPEFSGTPTAPTAAPGTNTLQIANTAMVQAALAALVTGGSFNNIANGYASIPLGSKNLIVQWGTVTSSGTTQTNATVTFPEAFPNACLWAGAGAYGTGNAAFLAQVASFTALGAVLGALENGGFSNGVECWWLAIGW